MVRLAVPLNLHIPPEPTKNLAKRFSGVNDFVTGVNVTCTVCKTRDKANSKLVKRPFVCGACR